MRKKGSLASFGASWLLTAMVGVAASGTSFAEKIGKVTQPLVAGKLVSEQEQEDQGLVSLNLPGGSCSGVLLNNEWVITAAHCFDKRPGEVQKTKITGNWTPKQSRKGRTVHILDRDIAILRVDKVFDVGAFTMPVFTGAMGPGKPIKVYGRGIHTLASGSGDTATPSQGDGKYRIGDFQVSRSEGTLFWFGPGKGGTIPAGGDSGGPAFIAAGGRLFLSGISSECSTGTIAGKPGDGWDWVNKIDECGYSPVGPVWAQIQGFIGTPACRNYASRAVGAVELTKYYNCDPKAVSGPRWSPNFDAHLNWCMHADPNVANAEDRARNTIAQECRIAAAMPQGTSALKVKDNGDSFALSGSGYAVNSRVIIRSSDSAGAKKNITSNFADASGNFAATLNSAEVCSQPGTVTFTAEDQDKPPWPPVNATCKTAGKTPTPPPPENPATPPPAENPAPPPAEKFVSVKLSVDLYDVPGGAGQKTGVLEAGTEKVALLEPCSDNWCHVRWAAGEGWVYSGPDYQSLKLP